MPAFVRKVKDDEWVATDESGKVFGRHPTRASAVKQVQAINISQQRKKGRNL